jgi:Tol biopolymer transport system component/lysophospholipase L1-like esterase
MRLARPPFGTDRSLSLAVLPLALIVVGATLSMPGARPAFARSTADRHLSQPGGIEAQQRDRLATAYARLPLSFELNRGQARPGARFVARGSGYGVSVGLDEFTLRLARKGKAQARATASVRFLGVSTQRRFQSGRKLPGVVNYLLGRNSQRWLRNVPTYSSLTERNLYPGIDLLYAGRQQQLEYTFLLRPYAHSSAIVLSIRGARMLRIDRHGSLVVSLPGGTLVERAPIAYQLVPGGGHERIAARFVLSSNNRVGFALGSYRRNRPLVIDPTLSYSTYLGGSDGDYVHGIAVDPTGATYVAGGAFSTFVVDDFPTKNPFQAAHAGGGYDAFVSKLNASGTALVYSTYLGGSRSDDALGIAVDSSGNAYVTGETCSPDFPTLNPLQGLTTTDFPCVDAFVTKLNSSGSGLAYSTYLGGHGIDEGFGIAVDSSDGAYVTGQTLSGDFPTQNPLQGAYSGGGDAFVTKLNDSGSALLYSTYLGTGTGDDGNAIAVDSSGNAYVTGDTGGSDFPTQSALQATYGGGGADAFVSKLNANGSAFVYSTFLGGSGVDEGQDIAVDSSGNAYVTGGTYSIDFPTKNAVRGAYGGESEAFISKLNTAGSALAYSTFLGGSAYDQGYGIAVDSSGNAYVTGSTCSADFPIVNSLQGIYGGSTSSPCGDAFVGKLNAAGSALAYSTYLGGSGGDYGLGIAVDSSSNAYVTGDTSSTDFPTQNAIQGTNGGNNATDAFIAKIGSNDAQPPSAEGRIVFVSGPEDVYTMNPDGSDITRLTYADHRLSGFYDRPAWSPDGKRIAMVGNDQGPSGSFGLFEMNADGSELHALADGPNCGAAFERPRWSPDGSQIIFAAFGPCAAGGNGYVVINADGTNPQPFNLQEPGFSVAHPDWSPNGTTLLWDYRAADGSNGIGTTDVDGTGFKAILTCGSSGNPACTEPSWSRDGSKIVYQYTNSATYAIGTVNADGTGQVLLTDPNAYISVTPRWSPDGTKIVFIRGGTDSPITVMSAAGTNQVSIGSGGSPDWGGPTASPVNHPPVWSIGTPADGTRFDLKPGTSTTFTATAHDPDGDAVIISWSFYTPSGQRLALDPSYVTCHAVQAPFDTTTLTCTVGPTSGGLAVMHIDASDAGSLSAGERKYLVGASSYQYVALGDSFSAGEGVDPYFRDGYDPNTGTQPGNIDNRCHRSTRAYAEWVQPPSYQQPLYAIASGAGDSGSGKRINKYGSDQNVRGAGGVAWVFWACSGAVIDNVSSGGQIQNDSSTGFHEQYTQLDNPSVNVATDLVTITIGGNDVGFTDILKKCAKTACATPAYEAQLDALVDQQKPRLVELYRAIRARTFNSRVLALGYPQIFPETTAERLCKELIPWRGEQDFLRRIDERLNMRIEEAADVAGVEFVPVAPVFRHHEVCGSAGAWINGFDPKIQKKLLPVGADDESFHPKLEGQVQGYAAAVNAVVAK